MQSNIVLIAIAGLLVLLVVRVRSIDEQLRFYTEHCKEINYGGGKMHIRCEAD